MSKALFPKWPDSDKPPRHVAATFLTMNLYKRKQSPTDVFIVDVFTASLPSYHTSKELIVITASFNRARSIALRKCPIVILCKEWGALSAGETTPLLHCKSLQSFKSFVTAKANLS